MKGLKVMIVAFTLGMCGISVTAQNSLPAPGSGGGFQPTAPVGGPGFGPGPGPIAPANWGSPWYSGWSYNPSIVASPIIVNSVPNQGITKVVACGYDSFGTWRALPLLVSYQYNGVQYNVNVLNAWNPITQMWDKGVDVQAFNTDYVLRNQTYDFYTVLPFGTFYFNL